MLKLYGFSLSNYFNMVKLALLEKGMDFEVVPAMPAQTEDYLAKSPRGKVPCLETPHGFLNETDAILNYLEESQGGAALLPADPYSRAKVRALMKEIELYIELPARLCFAEVFFGGRLSDEVKEKARTELLAGIATLKRHGTFSPYVAGEAFTLADIYFLYSVDLAEAVAKSLFDIDLLADFPVASALMVQLNNRPAVQQVATVKQQEMPAFIAAIRARVAA